MTDQPQYKLGDIANGYVLTADGRWVAVAEPVAPSAPPPTSAAADHSALAPGMGHCKGCGKVIATSARKCTNCGKNTARGELQNMVLGIGVAVVIFIIIGLFSH